MAGVRSVSTRERPAAWLVLAPAALVALGLGGACAAPASVTQPDAPPPAPASSQAGAADAPKEAPVVAPSSSAAAEGTPPLAPPSPPTATSATSAPASAAPALTLTQGKLPDAAKALAAGEALVRGCFQKAKAPPKSGNLTVKITVATSGFSLNVAVTPAGDVDKDTASCAKAALRDAAWGKPEGGGVAAIAGIIQAP